MTNNWPLVALGQVIGHRKDFIEIDDFTEYKRCRVQLHAKGIVLRDVVKGIEIKTKEQQVCQSGEFLVAEIDAKVGGFGIVPKELDEAIVSSHYFLFVIDETVLNSRFLGYFIRTPAFRDQVSARGSTNYAAIRPHHVLNYEIPLPSLNEQYRIVARIDELAAKVEQARALRRESVAEVNALFSSAINQFWREQDEWKVRKIGEISQTVSGQVDPQLEPYASLPHINGENIASGTCQLLPYQLAKEDRITSGKYHFRAGSILYSKIRPYLRKAVQVPVEGICSADIYAFESIDPTLEPRFFMYSLISPDFTKYANRISGRTRMPKLNQKQLFEYQLRYPSLSEQRRIVVYLDNLQVQMEAVKCHQAATAGQLEALFPSILDRAFRGEL